MTPPLTWRPIHGTCAHATFGDEGQGAAYASPTSWCIDVLPGDQEPTITGPARNLEHAKEQAERQAHAWPALIEGARRDG